MIQFSVTKIRCKESTFLQYISTISERQVYVVSIEKFREKSHSELGNVT